MNDTLDFKLLKAHARQDKSTLVDLYTKAADAAPTDDARYFFMTHAYIFALDTNHSTAGSLFKKLKSAGREA